MEMVLSLDFWYGESQKWIQICIWAPGPIFIPGFLHRSPAPVWMELELQSLNIECQMFLNAQRRCWSPKSDLLQLYKQTSTSSKRVPTHFPLTWNSQPRHVQVWQGWFWQDWPCKPRRKRKGRGVWGLWPVRVQWLQWLQGSLGFTPHPGCNRHHQDLYIIRGTKPTSVTGILGLGHVIQRLPRLPYWTAGKKWTSPKYMDLVEKPKLLGQKFTEIFLQGVGDSQGKIKPWSSVDPAKRWAFSKIMGNGRCEHAKKNTFQISLLLRVFSLPKTYGRSWVNCRTWVNSRGQKKDNNNNNNKKKPSCSLQLSMTCPVS